MKRFFDLYLVLILLGSLLFYSCQNKPDLTGMWVATNNEYFIGSSDHFIIAFEGDSVFIYDEFGIPLKARYQTNGLSVELYELRQLFSNEFYHTESKTSFQFNEDTLIWGEDRIKLIKSEYNTYLEHYVNSKGLTIELPSKSVFQKTDENNYEYIDAFFGFKEDGNVSLVINDLEIKELDIHSLLRIINNSKHNLHGTMVCRIFADKKIEMGIISDFIELLRAIYVSRIQYVTRSENGLMKNIYENPYSTQFSGINQARHKWEPQINEIPD